MIKKSKGEADNLPSGSLEFKEQKLDVKKIERALADPDVNIITISGVSGIGRTSLALFLGKRQRRNFPGGIICINCRENNSLSKILTAIAKTTNLDQPSLSSKKLQDAIVSYLRSNPALLILDDYEIVIDDRVFSFVGQLPKSTKALITIQEEPIKFHKPANQNDISVAESLIYPIFSKKNKENKHYWNEIRSLFLSAMKNANLNFFKRHIFWIYVNRTITKGLKKGMPLIEVEEILRKFIRKRADDEKDKKVLAVNRAKRSFELVEDYIVGEKILDLGAGDGLLALEIKEQLNKEVLLVDIVDYNYTDLPLILYDPEERIPLADEEVDTTILYTVLHHASDPEHLLKEATRITKERLVIIEAYAEEEDIRMTNSFFDWFYNRVIGDEDINVPLNFLRVKGWEKLLKSHGFDIIETKYLGINEPVVPEHQILIIADHINN